MTNTPGRALRLALLLSLASAPLGCGSPAAPGGGYVADEVGPHGGLLVPLPNDVGFGEVLARPTPKATARADGVLAAYFLAPDKAAALTPPPASASLKVRLPGQDAPADVALHHKPDAKDPRGGSLFVSEPGMYQTDQLFGDLIVELGGGSATIPFEKHR
ncbi:hypothetical protein [Paludisphaera soli]|uniref:hypothetical protein n=1 Tax=Paludisphaera soli TaxID=2712865 RepID=UPI0013EBADC0|nr:hypothetical protein [Paludisphaera soli]